MPGSEPITRLHRRRTGELCGERARPPASDLKLK